MSETATAETIERGLRKTRVGEVVSNKMQKTVVVRTTTRVPHPKFGKIVKSVKNSMPMMRSKRRKSATSSASWKPAR